MPDINVPKANLTTLYHADGRTCIAMDSQIEAMEAKGFCRTPPKAEAKGEAKADLSDMTIAQLRKTLKDAGVEITAVHDREWLEAKFAEIAK